MATSYTTGNIKDYLKGQYGLNNISDVKDDTTAKSIYTDAKKYGITADQLASTYGISADVINNATDRLGLGRLTNPSDVDAAKPPPVLPPPVDNPPTTPAAPGAQAAQQPAQQPTTNGGIVANGLTVNGQSIGDVVKGIMSAASASAPDPGQAAKVSTAPIQATTAEVPYEQTSAGIIGKLLDPSSDYMKRGLAVANEDMTNRGLLSSSIATNAALGAMIDRAGGLATNDSQIYANQRIANMNATNEMANANANRQLQAATTNANADNEFTLARYNAGNATANTILASTLRKDEASFGNTLTQDNMKLQSYLDKDKMYLAQEFTQGNMKLADYFDLKKMGYQQSLTLDQMGYAAKLDFLKMAQANDFDLQKMARSQGYTMEQMAAAFGYDKSKMELGTQLDLSKMAKGQEFDLAKMAAANGYDMNKMAVAFDNELKLMGAKSQMDTATQKDLMTFSNQLQNSATGRSALANLASQYAGLFAQIRADPNLDAETKEKALAQMRDDFRNQGQQIAGLYSLDATSYLAQVGISTPSTSNSSSSSGSSTSKPQNDAPGGGDNGSGGDSASPGSDGGDDGGVSV